MTTQTYVLRPILYWMALLLFGGMVFYPVYLVYFVGKIFPAVDTCSSFYGRWGIIEISHLVLWTGIFSITVAFYPLRLERDDDKVEYRLVMLAFPVSCPYDQILRVQAHWLLPCYIQVTTTLGSIILNPSGGVQAFIDDYVEARTKTSDRYGVSGPAAAPVETTLLQRVWNSGSSGSEKTTQGTLGLMYSKAAHSRKDSEDSFKNRKTTDPDDSPARGAAATNQRTSFLDDSIMQPPPAVPPTFTGDIEAVNLPPPPPETGAPDTGAPASPPLVAPPTSAPETQAPPAQQSQVAAPNPAVVSAAAPPTAQQPPIIRDDESVI